MSTIKNVTYFTSFRLGDSAILDDRRLTPAARTHQTMLSKTLYQDVITTTV